MRPEGQHFPLHSLGLALGNALLQEVGTHLFVTLDITGACLSF